MIIRSEFEHGSVFVGATEYYFQNFKSNVPEPIGKFLLSRGNYTVGLENEKTLGTAENILFIRGAGLGDIMLCVPIIRYIKKYVNPKSNIDWLCGTGEFESILDGVPYLRKVYNDKTLPSDVSSRYQFTIPIDYAEFKNTNESYTIHRIDVFARRVKDLKGVNITDRHLEYYINKEEIEWFKTLNIKKPYVAIATTTTCFNRVLTREMNEKIANEIIKAGYEVVMIEKNHVPSLHPKAINMTSKLNLRQVGSVLYHADAVVTPDTGIFHMASALNKPMLAYFGAINPLLRITSNKTIAIYNKVDCFPCNQYVCHHGRPICMQDMKMDYIIKNLHGVFALAKHKSAS